LALKGRAKSALKVFGEAFYKKLRFFLATLVASILATFYKKSPKNFPRDTSYLFISVYPTKAEQGLH
ncbi:MAG: hypothetical protein II323_03750, partial [Tidjanibacter sp.]|nr:hypothetical protein [Tidjanibacter sp.]